VGALKIHFYKGGEEKILEKSVVALGFFDGVHKGHRAILKKAHELARENSLSFAVFSFFSESEGIKNGTRLYSTEEKARLIEEAGCEELILADFNLLKDVSAEDFAEKILVERLGAKFTVSGEDFRFGKDRRGDSVLLSDVMKRHSARAYFVAEESYLGKKLSTTMIKELLGKGDARLAAQLLGKPFYIKGRVERGLGLGHGLGFPTVNLALHSQAALIKRGVYHSAVEIKGKLYTGLTNVGTCPTFDERSLHTETYILDFDGEIYGDEVRVYFLDYLREERKFRTKDELTEEVRKNIETAKRLQGEIKWQELGIN
jgi:riboflavin kinase/FMN adenylyltransferase